MSMIGSLGKQMIPKMLAQMFSLGKPLVYLLVLKMQTRKSLRKLILCFKMKYEAVSMVTGEHANYM